MEIEGAIGRYYEQACRLVLVGFPCGSAPPLIASAVMS
jgi:hypothetical protein